MGIEDDDDKAEEAHQHVRDREDAVHADVRVEIGEVIDGRYEGVPGEEVAAAEGEVDYVGQVEFVFSGLCRCGRGVGGGSGRG